MPTRTYLSLAAALALPLALLPAPRAAFAAQEQRIDSGLPDVAAGAPVGAAAAQAGAGADTPMQVAGDGPIDNPDSAPAGVKTTRSHFVIGGSKATGGPRSTGGPESSSREALEIKEQAASRTAAAAPTPVAKLQIKTLFYGDYAYYAKTGFGPQFISEIDPPGTGNDGYNAFEITRAYLNFYFSPDPRWTLRITPNLYRTVGVPAAAKIGAVSAAGQTVDGEENYRLKYAYLDYNKLFAHSPVLAGARLTIGQQMNPLVDWEEHLYGYRYTSLTPWNYLSLSSTQTGIAVHGPVKPSGRSRPVADYDVGFFDETNFHTLEQSDRKQWMGRVSVYPWGLTGRSEGMGFTAFGDLGDANATPDSAPAQIYRTALMAHFSGPHWGLGTEFDYGHNAFGSGNLFSGSGPLDQFGLGVTPFAGMDALAKAFLDDTQGHQRGYDIFGHVQVGTSRYEVFGLYEWFSPNVRVRRDPFDFRRGVAGVSYRATDYLRFAVDHQSLAFTHDPFLVTRPEIAPFSASLAAKNPSGIVAGGLVPIDAWFLHVELFY